MEKEILVISVLRTKVKCTAAAYCSTNMLSFW